MDSRLRRRPVGYQTWMVFLGGHFVRFVGCAAAAAGVAAAGGLVVGILCLVLVVLARFAVVVVAAAVAAVIVAAVTVHRVQTRTRNRPLSFCDSYSQPKVSMFF